MRASDHRDIWHRYRMTRREFLRHYGIAAGALTLSPFFIERFASVCRAEASLARVYQAKNGSDCFAGVSKLWELLGGARRFIDPTDVVVIKANAQWPNQGYTHTGCIKAVIDALLALPGFSGEVLLCDNIQGGGNGSGNYGFDVPVGKRVNNWPDMNWNELGAYYRSQGKPVGVVQWSNDSTWRTPPGSLPCFSTWDPARGNGWTRYFFTLNGRNIYVSAPVFASPVTAGRMIDMKNGVWEGGAYTGRRVKALFMPTLNNHDSSGGKEDYAGLTGAVKSFLGASELYHGLPYADDYVWNGFYNIHAGGFSKSEPETTGQMIGTFINNLYAPVLYITPAIYSGWFNRTATEGAAYTNTVLACTDPVSLDYIAGRDVISKCGSPRPTWLDPSTRNNNTWRQLLGCNSQGIGTVEPAQLELVTHDFNTPSTPRLEVERKIRDFRTGAAAESEVKDSINRYMDSKP